MSQATASVVGNYHDRRIRKVSKELPLTTKPTRDRATLLKLLLVTAGIIGAFVALLAWVFASPVGGAPDDDYHLASIWCPRPLASSGCTVKQISERTVVQVPETVARPIECTRFQPNKSAACADFQSDELYLYTARFDHGEYPIGYYQFHHLFVGDDVARSVLTMRVVNIGLALAGVIAVGALAVPADRRNMVLATFGAWIPLGVYLITSNNPSSWTVSGVFTYGSGLLCATRASGRRRWGLLAVAGLGALMAAGSRTDGSIYVIIVTAAVLILRGVSWRNIRVLLAAAATCAVMLAIFFSTGQSTSFTASHNKLPMPGFNQLLFDNVVQFPLFLLGFNGLLRGLGWADVHLYTIVGLASVTVSAALFMLVLRELRMRKVLAGGILLGAIVGLPLVVTMLSNQFIVEYQPRYLLPLMAVFYLVGLTTHDDRPLKISTGQAIVAAALLVLANSMALHSTIRRYTTGHDVLGFGLDHQYEWWWDIAISPMGVWVLGTVAFMVAIGCFGYLAHASTRTSAEPGTQHG